MSDNPFQTPTMESSRNYEGEQKPKALKVLCIICIVLGSLGLVSNIIGAVAFFLQDTILEFQQTMGAPSQQAMQAEISAIQQKYAVPNVILSLCSLFVSITLLVGGIAVLRKKKWSPKFLGSSLVIAAIFVFIRTAVMSFMQWQTSGEMVKIMTGSMQGAPNPEMMQSVMKISMLFGLAISVAWTAGLAGFYLWGWSYLRKDRCKAYFATFE